MKKWTRKDISVTLVVLNMYVWTLVVVEYYDFVWHVFRSVGR
jgi:hypothetical protein